MIDIKKSRELYDKKSDELYDKLKETGNPYYEGYADCLDVECGELLDEIESLEKDRKRFEDKYVRAAHSISNLEIELDRYKKALNKCKEQKRVWAKTCMSMFKAAPVLVKENEELDRILKGSE